jgi:hypothetical protein
VQGTRKGSVPLTRGVSGEDIQISKWRPMFSFWIQKHDYSSIEKADVSENEAINAFKNFDWENELKSFADDPALGKDCPAGIGIHNGFGQNKNAVLIHICPKDKDSVFFNFHYHKKRKFIGLFPYFTEEIKYAESFQFENVPELIHAAFNGNYDYILKL